MSADNISIYSEIVSPATKREFLIVKGHEQTGLKKPTNFLETLLHCLKGYLGIGIFVMGSAFLNSGLVLGPILLITFGILNLHCQHLLIKACVRIADKELVPVFPTFSETVQYTFEDSSIRILQKHSKAFGIVTDVFLLLTKYSFCVVYLIFIAIHLSEFAEVCGWKADYRIHLVIVLVPVWILSFLRNLRLLTPLSIISCLMTLLCVVFVMYYATKDLSSIEDRIYFGQANVLPLFFGITFFSLEAMGFIIPIRTEMQNPHLLTSPCGVLNVSMVIVLILYLMVGFLSYWKWGSQIKGSAFLNMPQDEPLSQATKFMISICTLMSLVLHFYIGFQIIYPRLYARYGPFKHPFIVKSIYKSLVLLAIYGLTNISHNIIAFVAFVGATSGAVIALLIPAFLDIVSLYGQLTHVTIFKNVLIIILAICGLITGTITSVRNFTSEFK